jgi:hypothetical protein
MRVVVIAAMVLVTSFALAIGCHHENDFPASTGRTHPQPQPTVGVTPDGDVVPIPDAAGPAGGGNSPGFPGTNQH